MRQLGKVGEVCTVDENVGEVSLRGFTPHYIVGPNRGAPPPPSSLRPNTMQILNTGASFSSAKKKKMKKEWSK